MLVLPEEGPRWERVYRALRSDILSGRLGAGARLPSTRELGRDLGFSRNTIEAAFDLLRAEGFIESRVGAGSFVALTSADEAALHPRPAATDGALPLPAQPKLSGYGARAAGFVRPGVHRRLACDFRYGLPDTDRQTSHLWHRALADASRETQRDDVLGYGDTSGWRPLREAIREYLGASRGVRCDVDQIVIVNGSQQGLDLAARVLLDPGDPVATEDPQYQGARAAFRSAGATLEAVNVDEDGMTTPTRPARLAYVTPSHQFPTGAVMSLSRRLGLLAWAEQHGAWVVEDDYDSEFRYDGPPLRSIHGLQESDRVIYLGTFSKLLFPALRLGYVVVPRPLLDAFLGAKWLTDRHSATLEQRALAWYMESGHFERLLRVSRSRYAERREALLTALERYGEGRFEVRGAATGLHVLGLLPDVSPASLSQLIAEAGKREVGVYPISPYYLDEGQAPAGLLFGFATLDRGQIDRGVAVLCECLRSQDGAWGE